MSNVTSSLQVVPHSGTGVEVLGVDLMDLDQHELDAIKAAYAEHGLVFFRDQKLNEDGHIAFAQQFGPINVNRFFGAHPQFPEIAMVVKEPSQESNIGGAWHTDHSYDLEPAMGSILVAKALPQTGGDTLFVSMYDAFDALSDGLKETLRGLRAVHSGRHVFGTGKGYHEVTDAGDSGDGRIGNAAVGDQLTDPVHPIVIKHPLSGREALYVNPAFTIGIEGWSEAESKALLDYLYQAAVPTHHVCRFQWQPGSVAFWDNRATWHFAQNDYPGQRREMHRITIEGCPLEASG